MPALHQAVRLAASLFRMDVRRPASWLMLAAAIGSGAAPDMASVAAMPAFVAGAVLAVAAIGDLPMAAGMAPGRGPWVAAVWLVERAGWPAVGLALVAIDRFLRLGPKGLALPGAAAAGLCLAALTVFMARRRAANAADAASLTLFSAGVAGAAGAAGGSAFGALPVMPAATGMVTFALAAWFAIGLVAIGIERRARLPHDWLHDDPPAGIQTPLLLRTSLTATAMATALIAMVGWLFLDSSRAGLALPLSLGWFIALAVPEATLGDGVAHTIGWRWLHRSAVVATSRRHLGRPGRGRDAVAATLSIAAILGWPPLVAAALAVGNPESVWAAAVTVLGLAAAAVALVAVVGVLEAVAATHETAQAVALALVLAMQVGVGTQFVSRGGDGGLPKLPGLPLPVDAVEPAQ